MKGNRKFDVSGLLYQYVRDEDHAQRLLQRGGDVFGPQKRENPNRGNKEGAAECHECVLSSGGKVNGKNPGHSIVIYNDASLYMPKLGSDLKPVHQQWGLDTKISFSDKAHRCTMKGVLDFVKEHQDDVSNILQKNGTGLSNHFRDVVKKHEALIECEKSRGEAIVHKDLHNFIELSDEVGGQFCGVFNGYQKLAIQCQDGSDVRLFLQGVGYLVRQQMLHMRLALSAGTNGKLDYPSDRQFEQTRGVRADKTTSISRDDRVQSDRYQRPNESLLDEMQPRRHVSRIPIWKSPHSSVRRSQSSASEARFAVHHGDRNTMDHVSADVDDHDGMNKEYEDMSTEWEKYREIEAAASRNERYSSHGHDVDMKSKDLDQTMIDSAFASRDDFDFKRSSNSSLYESDHSIDSDSNSRISGQSKYSSDIVIDACQSFLNTHVRPGSPEPAECEQHIDQDDLAHLARSNYQLADQSSQDVTVEDKENKIGGQDGFKDAKDVEHVQNKFATMLQDRGRSPDVSGSKSSAVRYAAYSPASHFKPVDVGGVPGIDKSFCRDKRVVRGSSVPGFRGGRY